MTNTQIWRKLLGTILQQREVTQIGRAHEPRDRKTKEIVSSRTVWDMRYPVIVSRERKLSRKFAIAEPAWILSGSNLVDPLSKHAPYLKKFSDDGVTLSGAYGPKIVDQLSYVADCLDRDIASRQAVINLWRERPGPSRDIPCTLSLQWLIRDNRLHCVATMRSSDAWLGVPYDVATFSIISAALLVKLRHRGTHFAGIDMLGHLYLTAGSQHLYAIDWSPAATCATEMACDDPVLRPFDPRAWDGEGPLAIETHLARLLIAVTQGELTPDNMWWLGELFV